MTGSMIDVLLCGLLIVTIGYAAILNKRLSRLRDEEENMQALIQDLMQSSERAEQALTALQKFAASSGLDLDDQIKRAMEMEARIAQATDQLDGAMARVVEQGLVDQPSHSGMTAPIAQLRAAADRFASGAL